MKHIKSFVFGLLLIVFILTPSLYLFISKPTEKKYTIPTTYQVNFLDSTKNELESEDHTTIKMDKNMKKQLSGSLSLTLSDKELLHSLSDCSIVLSKADSEISYQFKLTDLTIDITNLDVGEYTMFIKGKYPSNYFIQSRSITIQTNERINIDLVLKESPIIIKKTDELGDGLSNATFKILDENKNILYDDLSSGSTGLTIPFTLEPGTYYLEETMAPKHYQKIDKLIPFEVVKE